MISVARALTALLTPSIIDVALRQHWCPHFSGPSGGPALRLEKAKPFRPGKSSIIRENFCEPRKTLLLS